MGPLGNCPLSCFLGAGNTALTDWVKPCNLWFLHCNYVQQNYNPQHCKDSGDLILGGELVGRIISNAPPHTPTKTTLIFVALDGNLNPSQPFTSWVKAGVCLCAPLCQGETGEDKEKPTRCRDIRQFTPVFFNSLSLGGCYLHVQQNGFSGSILCLLV